MNRRALIIAALALFSCVTPSDHSQPENIFERVADVVYNAAKTPKEKRSKWFIPELDSASFPIGPESVWRNPTLVRLRRVDNRMVGDFMVSGNGQFIMTIWCEKQALGWLIAGWEPTLKPIVDMTHDRSRLSNIPKRFSTPILRNSPPSRRIRVASKADGPTDPVARHVQNQIVANVRASEFSETCRQKRLKRWLDKTKIFRSCHREFGLQNRHTGRLLFAVDASPPSPRIVLEESMFGHSGPRNCIMERMTAIRPLDQGCQFSLRVIFRSPAK
ncbi:MAG: hypothetical protein VYA30_02780 [Myxococcota bacterium]|nr:hypothetical protein [Myxococcota bacterium]